MKKKEIFSTFYWKFSNEKNVNIFYLSAASMASKSSSSSFFPFFFFFFLPPKTNTLWRNSFVVILFNRFIRSFYCFGAGKTENMETVWGEILQT